MILFDILLWFWLVLKVALKWTSRAIVKRIYLLSECYKKFCNAENTLQDWYYEEKSSVQANLLFLNQ